MPSSPLIGRSAPALALAGWPLSQEGKAAESKSTGPLLAPAVGPGGEPARAFCGAGNGAGCGCGGSRYEPGGTAGDAASGYAEAAGGWNAGGSWYVGGIFPRSLLAPSCRSHSGREFSSYRLRPGVAIGSPSQGLAGSGEGGAPGWPHGGNAPTLPKLPDDSPYCDSPYCDMGGALGGYGCGAGRSGSPPAWRACSQSGMLSSSEGGGTMSGSKRVPHCWHTGTPWRFMRPQRGQGNTIVLTFTPAADTSARRTTQHTCHRLPPARWQSSRYVRVVGKCTIHDRTWQL
jgi:hypothetical protein